MAMVMPSKPKCIEALATPGKLHLKSKLDLLKLIELQKMDSLLH